MKKTASVTAIRQIMQGKLHKAGLSAKDSCKVANAILYAEQSGILSHGIVRFPIYLKQIKDGNINAKAKIKTDRSESILKVNGDNGLGIIVAETAMRQCVKVAKEKGICAASIHHSNHFGTAGYYTRIAAAKGCIGFICSVAGPTMAPFGGKEMLLGSDPFSVSFPYLGHVFTLDISSSATAKGKIRIYASQGKQIPLGWALNVEGNPTTDPKEAIKGIVLPMAGHKGYGIALVVETLSALLSGACLSHESTSMFELRTPRSAANIGHFATAIDIAHFLPLKNFESRAAKWLDMLSNSKTRAGFDKVMIPGEFEKNNRNDNKFEIELDADLHNELFQKG